MPRCIRAASITARIPKALANQHKKTQTDEYAVMLDGLNPIHVLPAGEQVEWKEYWASWMEKKKE